MACLTAPEHWGMLVLCRRVVHLLVWPCQHSPSPPVKPGTALLVPLSGAGLESPLCPDEDLLMGSRGTEESWLSLEPAAACAKYSADASSFPSPLMEQKRSILLFCLHMNTFTCVHLYPCNTHKPISCYGGSSVKHDFGAWGSLKGVVLSSWDGNPPANLHLCSCSPSGGGTVTMAAGCNHGKSYKWRTLLIVHFCTHHYMHTLLKIRLGA